MIWMRSNQTRNQNLNCFKIFSTKSSYLELFLLNLLLNSKIELNLMKYTMRVFLYCLMVGFRYTQGSPLSGKIGKKQRGNPIANSRIFIAKVLFGSFLINEQKN